MSADSSSRSGVMIVAVLATALATIVAYWIEHLNLVSALLITIVCMLAIDRIIKSVDLRTERIASSVRPQSMFAKNSISNS
jgi:hypothetical protein